MYRLYLQKVRKSNLLVKDMGLHGNSWSDDENLTLDDFSWISISSSAAK